MMSDLLADDLKQRNRQGQAGAPSETAAKTISGLKSSQDAGLTSNEARRRIAQEGPNDIQEKKARPILVFARKFWGVSAWMIELIIVLSLILGKHADFWIALSLLVVNAVLGFVQEQRASKAVAALRSKLRVTARVLRDGSWRAIPAQDLVSGDVLRLRAGDFVPADAQVIVGELQVDQSALTGESQEIKKANDDVLYSGSIVQTGEATAVVVATGARTYFGRTAELVGRAHPKLHVEEVTTRIIKWLVAIVGILLSVALVVSIIEGLRLLDTVPLMLILLMSALPVALPVMFTVSMAIGAMELARHGVLVTRLTAAEDAATMDVVCADKTGTLTMNRVSLSGVLPQPGFRDDDVLRCGALASNEANQDPVDLAFLRSAREHGVLADSDKTLSFTPFSPKTRRTEALVEINGLRSRLLKGAVRTVADAVGLDAQAAAALNTRVAEAAGEGVRTIAVAQAAPDEPLKLVGLAFLRDTVRPDSRRLIDELQSLGVVVKMLTGDALPVARQVALGLGLGKVARAIDLRAAPLARASVPAMLESLGGLAEVFPEDKYTVVKNLQAAGYIVGMTGDGVNDAPALGQAEVGIAVENATDVAKGAASVVLTTEGLGGIVELVKIGRAIYQRVLTWVINKVSQTVLASSYVVIAFLITGRFVISALGMMLLIFMTDFVKIALSTDHVRPSQKPETWNISPLILLGAGLGALMLVEALGLLAIGWRHYDLAAHHGQMHNFAFQSLLFFGLFSIFSIRERRPFWASRASNTLATALVADGVLGFVIGIFGLGSLAPLLPEQIVVIIMFALVSCLGLNDLFKTMVLRRLAPAHTPTREDHGFAAETVPSITPDSASNDFSNVKENLGWASAAFAILIVSGAWLFWISSIGINHGPAPNAGRTSVARTIAIDGVIEQSKVILRAPDVSGKIAAVHCARGETIEAGAVCAEIIPIGDHGAVNSAKIDLISARARLTADEQRLVRATNALKRAEHRGQPLIHDRRKLKKTKLAHIHALAMTRRAREEVDRRSTALRAAESLLSPRAVISPVRGTVVVRNAETGQFVAADSDTPLFVVAPLGGPLEVRANLTAEEGEDVKAGAMASFTVDSLPGRLFKGQVTEIRAQPQTAQDGANYVVVIRSPDAEFPVNPAVGQKARIVIDVREEH